jgi:hypothetical protein
VTAVTGDGAPCPWCGCVTAPTEPAASRGPAPGSSPFTSTAGFRPDLSRPGCPRCADLPRETAIVNRLPAADALDLLACQVVGLSWEGNSRGVAEKLGLTTWAEYVAAVPDAAPPDRPFG